MASSQSLTRLLTDILSEPEAQGWRGKWQTACETLWDTLNSSPDALVDVKTLECFIKLLSDPAKFSLARMVIPDLRETAPAQQHRHRQQREILEATEGLRIQQRSLETTMQADFDDILYIAEKRERIASELHVVRVMLHDSGAFGSDREEEIQAWLAKHPDLVAKGKTDN